MNKMFKGNIITFGNKNLFLIHKDGSRWHIISQNRVIGVLYVNAQRFIILRHKFAKLQQRHAEIVRYFLIEHGFKE